jgi:hypothetical protein
VFHRVKRNHTKPTNTRAKIIASRDPSLPLVLPYRDRMNGPINKDKRKIGLGLGKLEVVSVFFGLVVVLGLFLELGAEIKHVISARVWPSRELIGGILVAIGVFGEVALSIFISRDAKRAQMNADERIALAEKATADANLARVRIEDKFKARSLTDAAYSDLQQALGSYVGTRIDIFAFGHSQLAEVMRFAVELMTACRRAGCDCKVWKPGPSITPPSILTGSVLMTTARESTAEQNEILGSLANIFASALTRSGIKFTFSMHGFSDTDPVAPNPLPANALPWNPNNVARFRLEIIEKSLLDSLFAP